MTEILRPAVNNLSITDCEPLVRRLVLTPYSTNIWSALLHLVLLLVFVVHFSIWLCCEYLLCVSVFGCVVNIWSALLHLVLLLVFAVHVSIWLCCEYLLYPSVFGCVVSICCTLLYLVALWVYAAYVNMIACICCQTDDVFLISWCFFICSLLSSVHCVHPSGCVLYFRLSLANKLKCKIIRVTWLQK